MIRNLKALGLALVAMFAFGALAAAAASAQGVLTSDGPVTLTGTEIADEVHTNALFALGGNIECLGSKYTGHAVLTHEETTAGKTHKFLSASSTTATITPHYATVCTAKLPILGNRPATVTMNGCDYVFHIGATTTETVKGYKVTADLVCPPEKDVEVHIYKLNPPNHEAANSICTLTIKPQNGLGGEVGVENEGTAGNKNIILTGTFTEIHFGSEGTVCPNKETNEDGELGVSVTITGDNEEGGHTDIELTD